MARDISAGNYYFIAKIINFEQVETLNYHFNLIVGNSEYIKFGLAFRLMLIGFSGAIFINYYKKIKQVSASDLLDE